jgi:hypothetical protein
MRRYIGLTMYHPVYLRARERNQTAAYQRERFRRRTISEGIFASVDRLGWEKSRLGGLWKLDCEGYMAALAHNVLKPVRKIRWGVGPPAPSDQGDAAAFLVRDDQKESPESLGVSSYFSPPPICRAPMCVPVWMYNPAGFHDFLNTPRFLTPCICVKTPVT